MLVIFLLIVAFHSLKNTATDFGAMVTGNTPPSHARQMARIAQGSNGRPNASASGFFRNAYGDAWETANDYRQRYADKSQQKRHGRWAEQDGANAPVSPEPDDDGGGTSAPLPTPVAPSEELPDSEIPDVNPVWESEPAPDLNVHRPVNVAPEGLEYVSDRKLGTLLKEAFPPEDVPGSKNLGTMVQEALGDEDTSYYRYEMLRRNGAVPDSVRKMSDDMGISLKEAEALRDNWDRLYEGRPLEGHPEDYTSYHRYVIQRRNGEPLTTVEEIISDHGASPEDAARTLDIWSGWYEKEFPVDYPAMSDDEVRESYLTSVTNAVELLDAGDKEASQVAIKEAGRAATHLGISDPDELQKMYEQGMVFRDAKETEKNEPTTKEVTTLTTSTSNSAPVASAETTGLQAGLAFYAGMSRNCGEGATNVEISNGSLSAGKVGPSVTGPAAQGMEYLVMAQASFDQAHAALKTHITVQEQYEATPDAGDKGFVTS